MFEQLNDTQPFAAETKNRRNYFLVTTVVLGIALISAMIISLFTIDLNLGMGDSDMVELIAPVEIDQQSKPPEPMQPQQPKGGSAGAAAPKVAMRQVNMARIDESPTDIPTTVVTTQNSKARFDAGRYEIGRFDSDPGAGGSGRSTSGDGSGDGNGLGDGRGDELVGKVESDDVPPPPPAKPVSPKPATQILGVVNGRATSLPLPTLTAAAKAANASGTVSVQVLVDEKGNVISANAVSGSPLLRASSEVAARAAKFSQTLLAGIPVKISGIINYHFEG